MSSGPSQTNLNTGALPRVPRASAGDTTSQAAGSGAAVLENPDVQNTPPGSAPPSAPPPPSARDPNDRFGDGSPRGSNPRIPEWHARWSSANDWFTGKVSPRAYLPNDGAAVQESLAELAHLLGEVRHTGVFEPEKLTQMRDLVAFVDLSLQTAEMDARLNPHSSEPEGTKQTAKALKGWMSGRGAVANRELADIKALLVQSSNPAPSLPDEVAQNVHVLLELVRWDTSVADLEKRLHLDGGKRQAEFVARIPDGGTAARRSLALTRETLEHARGTRAIERDEVAWMKSHETFARYEILAAEIAERIAPGTEPKHIRLAARVRTHMVQEGALTNRLVTEMRTALDAGRRTGTLGASVIERLEPAVELARLDVRVGLLEKRLKRMRAGWQNAISVAIFDTTTEEGKNAEASIKEARRLLNHVAATGSVNPATAWRIEAHSRAADTSATLFAKRRATLTEAVGANAAYFGARAYMEPKFRRMEQNGEVRWDAETDPKTGRLNYSGLVKEFIRYEIPNVILRFVTMGNAFNPFNRETMGALWGELGGAAAATAGSLFTSMMLRRYTSLGQKGELGKLVGATIGACFFSSFAGWFSYKMIDPEQRGSSLSYAAIRALFNGIFRYAAFDGLVAVLRKIGTLVPAVAQLGASMGWSTLPNPMAA